MLGLLVSNWHYSSGMRKQMETIGQDVPKEITGGGLEFLNSIPAQCHLPDSGDEGPDSSALHSQQAEAQRSSLHCLEPSPTPAPRSGQRP